MKSHSEGGILAPFSNQERAMNKNEQNRVVAWHLKLLRRAIEMPGGVAQTCRHLGLSRKAFYKMESEVQESR